MRERKSGSGFLAVDARRKVPLKRRRISGIPERERELGCGNAFLGWSAGPLEAVGGRLYADREGKSESCQESLSFWLNIMSRLRSKRQTVSGCTLFLHRVQSRTRVQPKYSLTIRVSALRDAPLAPFVHTGACPVPSFHRGLGLSSAKWPRYLI